MRGGNVIQKRFAIVFPFSWQVRSRSIFATRQFQRDFESVRVDVVEILHSALKIVPASSVRYSVLESDTAGISFFHERMTISVILG